MQRAVPVKYIIHITGRRPIYGGNPYWAESSDDVLATAESEMQTVLETICRKNTGHLFIGKLRDGRNGVVTKMLGTACDGVVTVTTYRGDDANKRHKDEQ